MKNRAQFFFFVKWLLLGILFAFPVSSSGEELSQAELKYLSQHPSVSIAIDTSWVPYAYKNSETGEVAGILRNILDTVAAKVGLHVDYKMWNSYSEALKAVQTGETEMVSGVAEDPMMAKKNDVQLTLPYISISYCAVSKGRIVDLWSAPHKVAVCKGSYAINVMKRYMPKSVFVEYTSNQQCLDAVRDGAADTALVASHSVSFFMRDPRYSSLSTILLNNFSWNLCFGVNADSPPELVSLLNQGLSALSPVEVNQAIYLGMLDAVKAHTTLLLQAYEHPFITVVFLFLFCSGIWFVLFKRRQVLNLQENLRLSERIRDTKSEFLSYMSHEIRTPMNGILGLSRLMEDMPNITNEIRENIKNITVSGNYILSIVNHMLNLSKLESGKFESKPEPISCKEVLSSILLTLSTLAQNKGVIFSSHATGDAKVKIMLDRMYLVQIIMNLTSNAIKFTPEGGLVSVRLDIHKTDTENGLCTLIVRDTGIGMSETFQQRMYLPFEQESSSKENDLKGTGLGLTVVKQLVDRLKGKLNVTSELGRGTEFIVSIKCHLADNREPEKVILHNRGNLEGKCVLLVDDHLINTLVARKMLEKQGVHVDSATDGQKAVCTFQNSPPFYYDAVLMDIRMPVMDGLAATRTIRSMDRADALSIPIVAMTANAFEDDKRAYFKVGMNACLAKPIEPTELYTSLEHLFSKKISSDEEV